MSLFPVLFAVYWSSVLVWFLMASRLCTTLSRRHPLLYDALGRPALAMGSDFRGDLALMRFLLGRRYRFVDDRGTAFNAPSDCVLEPAWSAYPVDPWPDLEVVERVGCDLMPIDVTSTEGRLALTAYVWPDQAARLERLRGALAVAQRHPPDVRAVGASELVESIELERGTWTVLWHSVMWQYLPAEEQARATSRIEALGAAADEVSPFAHLFLEPTRRDQGGRHEFLVVLTTWPGGVRRVLGEAAPHGLPVTWA